MPNIEIHGYGIRGEYAYIARDLRTKIFALLIVEAPHVSDAVVTVFDDWVTDEAEKRQPFLRLVSTPSPHIDEIVELLKTLDIDIEVQELKAFHPKKSARSG